MMKNNEWGQNWGVPAWMVARRRVLVVEDMPEMAQLIERYLSVLPVELELAGDGLEGMERVRKAELVEDPIDLVLLDMEMPRCDGYAAARRLRAEGYGGVIVAVTAHSAPEQLDAALEAGCDVFLAKPITRARIARTVRSTLDIG